MNEEPGKQGEQEQGRAWQNIGKIIFLFAALIAAWFVLEWLAGGK